VPLLLAGEVLTEVEGFDGVGVFVGMTLSMLDLSL